MKIVSAQQYSKTLANYQPMRWVGGFSTAVLTQDKTNGQTAIADWTWTCSKSQLVRDAKYGKTKIETSANPDRGGMINIGDDLIGVF